MGMVLTPFLNHLRAAKSRWCDNTEYTLQDEKEKYIVIHCVDSLHKL